MRILPGLFLLCLAATFASPAFADRAPSGPSLEEARSAKGAVTARIQNVPTVPIAGSVPSTIASPGASREVSVRAITQALIEWTPPARGKREIETHFVSPLDQSHAVELRGAFPNPFHSETAIRFAIPAASPVSVRLFDVSGKLVRTLIDAQLPAGDHSAMLRSEGLPAGAYFVQLRAGVVQASRKIIIVR